MNREVIIIGASGHGRVIADIVRASGDILLGFLDDDPAKKTLGPVSDHVKYPGAEFVVGIGNAAARERISSIPVKWYTAVHPAAVVSLSASIGEGSVVMPCAVINADAVIGRHCIVNSGAIVEHDDRIEDYAHISVGAKLGGTVSVGRKTWVGIGAAVKNNVSICADCVIGAGAVVIHPIEEKGTYIGVPAERMRKAADHGMISE